MPFDTEADESSARVLGIRPARQVDALRPVSDKQHFAASVKRVPAIRENENPMPAFEIARIIAIDANIREHFCTTK